MNARRLAAGIGLWVTLGGLGALALFAAWPGSCSVRPARVLRPTPQPYRDLAVSCLALGSVSPPVAELDEGEFEAMTRLVARILHAYETADFDSFLALRIADLGFAGKRRADDLEELRGFCRQLAISESELGGDWPQTLEVFWRAYYAEPPVVRFLPEGTRVELHTEGLRGARLEEWERSFDVLRDRVRGPWIEHELVVPHRRSLARIAADAGLFAWLDLELAFETRAAEGARLVTRFVWDGAAEGWFLQRAATVYTPGDRSDRHLIL